MGMRSKGINDVMRKCFNFGLFSSHLACFLALWHILVIQIWQPW